MKKRILYSAAALFGLLGIWFLLPTVQILGGLDFFTVYLNVLLAGWIYEAGGHSVLIMDAGHLPMLTPFGVFIFYGIPSFCFVLAARRVKKEPPQHTVE